MSGELTPWFPVSFKPVRAGLYEARYPECPKELKFRYWNGTRWSYDADGGETFFGANPADKWRGLAKEPK